jgi:hypothetical protein
MLSRGSVSNASQLHFASILQGSVENANIDAGSEFTRSLHMQSYVEYADFERIVEALRREFRQLIENAPATGKKAATISENVFAALKLIETALADQNSRLVRLAERADANANPLTELKTLFEKQELFEKVSGRAVGRVAVRLEGFEQRIAALADQLPALKNMIERLLEEGNHTISATLDARLAEVQNQINGLISRLDLGEKGHADLSSLIKSSVASLVRGADDLEQRFKSKFAELEARLNSSSSRANSLTDNVTHTGLASPSDGEQPVAAAADTGSNGRDAVPRSLDAPDMEQRVKIMSVEIRNGQAHVVRT